MAAQKTDFCQLIVKWSGKEYAIDDISSSSTVGDLKTMISEKTKVLPQRQKLLGLKYKGLISFLENYMMLF